MAWPVLLPGSYPSLSSEKQAGTPSDTSKVRRDMELEIPEIEI